MEKPSIPQVLPLIMNYYSKTGNGSGGVLHIVLDDGNIDNDDIEFCLEKAHEIGDTDGVIICEHLLRMSKTQRGKLYKLKK